MIYKVSQYSIKHTRLLIDCDTNGSITGNNVRILKINDLSYHINICGINNHKLINIFIIICTGNNISNKGLLTLIMNQYVSIGKDYSIHVLSQLKYHCNTINNKIITNNRL